MTRISVILGIVLMLVGCQGQEPLEPKHEQLTPKTDSPRAAAPSTANAPQSMREVTVAGTTLATCAPSERLENIVSHVVAQADSNQDQRISKKEAQGWMNFLLGGLFFRADENGDGTVTPEEGRAARREFVEQNAAAAALLEHAHQIEQSTGKNPLVRLAEITDIEYDQPISAKDVKESASSALSELYRIVDKDKDSLIGLEEARAASLAGARALGNQAFAAADANDDGALEVGELDSMLESSLKPAFAAADANSDGKLSEEESIRALDRLGQTIAMAMPTIQ